ncbi:MAG TPA: phosphotransferase family protein, partial [Acidimicrobiales bacterium]|nr:phosphotransferase family protein [Acidimicrobiales bacterium]
VVVRRPPLDGVLATAHDMRREWRFISALRPTPVPVPEPIAFDAGELLGVPCYAMAHVEGVVLHDAASAAALDTAARRAVSLALVDTMAALHAVDIDAVGLGDIAKRGDYLGRQLRRWRRQWEASVCTDVTAVAEAHRLLEAAAPQQRRTSTVHGDLRLGNVICGSGGDVRAVLDWELATLGDPLADLGWLLSYWTEPGGPEAPPPGPGAQPSVLPGFPRRAELAARYAERSGADLDDLEVYLAFASWRSACISAGVLTRYQSGAMGDDGFDHRSLRDAVVERAETALAHLGARPRTARSGHAATATAPRPSEAP